MTSIETDTKVRYKSVPSSAGWVVGVSGDSARVFIDGAMKLVPVSELEVAPGLVELSPTEFRNALTLQRLEHPATDQFLSFKASKTKLLYHQFLPVKKMLESPDQRLLIADEVGTGKTIEAGLIWAELESRAIGGLENVWVVCPKSLVGKWEDEMLQRFDFRLEALTSEGLQTGVSFVRARRGDVTAIRKISSESRIIADGGKRQATRNIRARLGLGDFRRSSPPSEHRHLIELASRFNVRSSRRSTVPDCYPVANTAAGHSEFDGYLGRRCC